MTTRSIRLRYDNGQPLSSVSLSPDQNFAAVGCGSHVGVVALDERGAHDHITIQLKSTGRFTVTDVGFAPQQPGVLAASGTNGMIAVFDFHVGQDQTRTGGRYSCLWDSGETPRSVNKVTWHPNDSSVLLSCGMDGLVKLYDLRFKNECRGIFNPKSEATRDVAFNPFDPNQFAALSENGTLSLWDSRNMDSAVLKISAHTMFGLSLAWNPSRRGILATGSRDKTVKVWDLLRASRDTTAVEAASAAAAAAGAGAGADLSGTFSGAKTEKEIGLSKEAIKPVNVIHTPASVGRVRWRNGERFHNQLATASLSTESTGGEIHLWDVGMPNTPACVLSGHTEICTDFQWLDTPKWQDPEATAQQPSGKASRDDSGNDKKSKRANNNNAMSPSKDHHSGRRLLEHAHKHDVLESPKTSSALSAAQQNFLGVHQHVLSVGKDGQLLVQDIRCAFFPRQHMSGCVTAISAIGHVAFQRGLVVRDDPIGLIANRDTANAPGWFKDDRRCFGMSVPGAEAESTDEATAAASTPQQAQGQGKKGGSKSSKGARGEKKDKASQKTAQAQVQAQAGKEDVPAATTPAPSVAVDETGSIYVGLTNINDLGSARGIRESMQHGAEAGVFDPAVISLLARKYQTGHTTNVAGISSEDSALAACEHNLHVSKEAGLRCRSALWATARSVLYSIRMENATALGDADADADAPLVFAGSTTGGLPATLPFGIEILGELLVELLEGGDCQHFVLLSEVLKHARIVDAVCTSCNISIMQRREVYLAYFELLSQMRLFSCVVSFMKDSDEEYISRVGRHGTTMHTSCAKCGKELTEDVPWCKKCNRFAAICSLCQQPVRGLMHWCPICGHGSHLDCSKLWFKENTTCPSGCGHNCCDHLRDNSVIRIVNHETNQYN